jgi:glycolate oxidase FAD binding subunit
VRLTDIEIIELFTGLLGSDRLILSNSPNHAQLWQSITQSLTPDSLAPVCILYPQSIAELSQIMVIAYEQRLRVLPCGNATKLDWGGLVSRADLVVSTSGLNQVIEHCVGDLTVTVQAGVKYQDLQDILAKQGQFLAIDPPYSANATIGGILATGSAGSLRHRYNGVRDMCLGMEFVRGDGKLAKAGGRVVKNVAGYDLMKLLTGSYGTLGIATTITFRLYPLPEFTQVVLITGTAAAIASAHQTISSSVLTPTACDLLSTSAIAKISSEFNLGNSLGNSLGQNIGLALQFASLKTSVLEQSDRLAQLAQELGLDFHVLPNYQQFWQSLAATMWRDDLRNCDGQDHLVCKLGVLPSTAIATVQQCQEIFAGSDFAAMQIHMGSGLGILRVEGIRDIAAIASQIAKVRDITDSCGGFLSILEAPQSLKFGNGTLGKGSNNLENVWGYRGNARDLMVKIQQQFDPSGLLSCDRL